MRLTPVELMTASHKREFIKAVHKGNIIKVRLLIRRELVDAFAKSRKGEEVNPLYIAIKR